MRLKEWLIAQIDSGRYPGLRWENRHRTLFRIPWKHAAKQDYRQQEDAALFKVPRAPRCPRPALGEFPGLAPELRVRSRGCPLPEGLPAPCAPRNRSPSSVQPSSMCTSRALHYLALCAAPGLGSWHTPLRSVHTPGAPGCPAPCAPLRPPRSTQLPQDTPPWFPTAPPAPGDSHPAEPPWTAAPGVRLWQPPQHRAPCVPQAWAIYKGKYQEGTDKADPSTWKTRLRCALNKSTDFQEVPERSQLDISEPYKVYQIVTDRGCGAGTSLLSLLLCQMWG